jgi:hypothetical protein
VSHYQNLTTSLFFSKKAFLTLSECEEGEEKWSRGMPGRAGARVSASAASSLTAVLMSINQASRAQHRGGGSSPEI